MEYIRTNYVLEPVGINSSQELIPTGSNHSIGQISKLLVKHELLNVPSIWGVSYQKQYGQVGGHFGGSYGRIWFYWAMDGAWVEWIGA